MNFFDPAFSLYRLNVRPTRCFFPASPDLGNVLAVARKMS